MGRAIEIIDPEGERRSVTRRRILILAALVSFALFGYPEAKDYHAKWRALKAGRALATYLSAVKTRAILEKTPLELRFKLPDQIELYKVTSCGPFAERGKLGEVRLAEFEQDVEFAPEPWVREHAESREPYLPRFCYDPVYGSSISGDGLVHGGVFLAHKTDLAAHRGEHLVQVLLEGAAGDASLE